MIADALKLTLAFCLGALMIQSGVPVNSVAFFALPGLALGFYFLGAMFGERSEGK